MVWCLPGRTRGTLERRRENTVHVIHLSILCSVHASIHITAIPEVCFCSPDWPCLHNLAFASTVLRPQVCTTTPGHKRANSSSKSAFSLSLFSYMPESQRNFWYPGKVFKFRRDTQNKTIPRLLAWETEKLSKAFLNTSSWLRDVACCFWTHCATLSWHGDSFA